MRQLPGVVLRGAGFQEIRNLRLYKPQGETCRHLEEDDRCAIHDTLDGQGFPGCIAYQCFGAGQKLVQSVYPGRSWRDSPAFAEDMFNTYFQLKAIHELISYLMEAESLCVDDWIRDQIAAEVIELEAITNGGAEIINDVDLANAKGEVSGLIARVERPPP
ncbi:MAG: hypothetical protein O3A84_09680 [Proteobacteria bacterium]|nr:hypothetical protein [Pseudomonadota bacterium]